MMIWFKKWYQEKFMSSSKKKVLSIVDVNEESKNSVDIKIISKASDSIVIDSDNQNQKKSSNEIRQTIKSTTINNSNEISNTEKPTKVNQSWQQKQNLLVDKEMIREKQQTDIETWTNVLDCKQKYLANEKNSLVTDVNENGYGESDSCLEWQSKESRLFFKTTNSCLQAIKQVDNSESISNIDQIKNIEWPINQFKTNCRCELFQYRTDELNYFISDIGAHVKKSSKSFETNIRKFNCPICDEQTLNDWVVVSVELKPIAQCESSLDEEQIHYLNESALTVQYYTSCEYNNIDRRPIVTLHHCSSNFAAKTAENCHYQKRKGYGIFRSANRKLQQLLRFVKLLNINIKTGTTLSDSSSNGTSAVSINMNYSTLKLKNLKPIDYKGQFISTKSICRLGTLKKKFENRLQEPCTSSKNCNFTLDQNGFSKDSMKSSSACIETNSIPEYFGLNEDGDIIIHLDHICEEKGFGFMMRRKKELYRKVPFGEEVYEKDCFSLGTIKKFFKSIGDKICKCYRGKCLQINK